MAAKPESYENIVQTASRLFFHQGYHATGLNQILAESGSPKGSLYYYFPHGKEELALECIRRGNEFIKQKLKQALSGNENPVVAIQDFIRHTAEEADRLGFDSFMPIGFWAAAETSCISESLRHACVNTFTDWQHIYMERLQESGLDEKKAHSLAVLIISMLEGALILAVTQQSSAPIYNIVDYIPQLVK
ncbi:TetR/AcrR family transcriptional regulator [Paenibacillus polymyxa]|uniref:Transcriptional regulator n=1 Tax=Paenibacillus polymyxa (strain SC2) TaxID=886882 RepID=E3E657_PAEPS|nr:TetR/AcrR family transcriptional regulator [Paenibacillus polymyxa]ADO56742.1 transcriptional regulator [Paenibacillus polymyxa SC2]WPQ54572.1 TetR/AcrR family transcriptional regulator [Paenibacillus polymyxa]CCC85429.1 HTH-type transcriptional repressor dhaR [Paenibacillus polymyxa M1]